MTAPTRQHADTCGFHLDNYPHECDCGVYQQAAPARPTCWAHSYTLGSYTPGEADAARAMRDRIVARMRDDAAQMRLDVGMRTDLTADFTRSNAAVLDHFAEIFAQFQPRAEVSGLCERGA